MLLLGGSPTRADAPSRPYAGAGVALRLAEVVLDAPEPAPRALSLVVGPAERVRTLTYEEWRAIVEAFPPEEEWMAARIMLCESGGDPSKVGADGERGLMQIHPIWIPFLNHLGYTWQQMFDPLANMEVASGIVSRYGWAPWSCLSSVRRSGD